jgi:hypothetical protein
LPRCSPEAAGRLEEARAVLEEGVQLGDVESVLPLGTLYADHLDEDDLAEVHCRLGADAGDALALRGPNEVLSRD